MKDFQRKFVEETKGGAWIVELTPVIETTKRFDSLKRGNVVRAGNRAQSI